MSTAFNHLYLSCVKLCQETIDELGMDIEFLNVEAHADISEWPNQDILGIGMFSVVFDEESTRADVAFAVSTTADDQHLFRHVRIVDVLTDKLMPKKQVTVVSADTGARIGWMQVIPGTEVRPVERTEKRAVRYVLVSFVTTPGYQLVP